nr:hypothetical protein [Tanacetum cinerariifolium]
MSCNGCRVLRKGCNENCILKQSIIGIETAQAQASATVFVAKFFGRAGLLSFLSSVLEHQRPALFQSLLFEACGRTVNPINGAVGLLWTGNWHVCQSAVATILRGGSIQAMPELFSVEATQVISRNNNASEIGVTRSEGAENSDSWMENVSETTTSESGTLGLLWTGNWHVCQSAVATILRGGSIQAMPELFSVEATKVISGNNNASEIGVTRSEGGENSDPWMENISETTTSESGTRSGSTCTEAKLLTLFL